jgi:hypothetical protein
VAHAIPFACDLDVRRDAQSSVLKLYHRGVMEDVGTVEALLERRGLYTEATVRAIEAMRDLIAEEIAEKDRPDG